MTTGGHVTICSQRALGLILERLDGARYAVWRNLNSHGVAVHTCERDSKRATPKFTPHEPEQPDTNATFALHVRQFVLIPAIFNHRRHTANVIPSLERCVQRREPVCQRERTAMKTKPTKKRQNRQWTASKRPLELREAELVRMLRTRDGIVVEKSADQMEAKPGSTLSALKLFSPLGGLVSLLAGDASRCTSPAGRSAVACPRQKGGISCL